MNIKYKNSLGKTISSQQAQLVKDYSKLYINNNDIVKIETFYKNSLISVEYSNFDQLAHSEIIGLLNQSYSNCMLLVVEKQNVNLGYEFHESYHYTPECVLIGSSLKLFDSDMNLVAVRKKDNMGNLLNDGINKWFYDLSKDPDFYIFKSEFHHLTGEFECINYFDDSTMHPQDKLYLLNTPEDLQKLIDLTGIPLALAQYYFTNEIEPNF